MQILKIDRRREFEDIVNQLNQIGAKRIFVQFPEGLRIKIQDISKDLEKEGFEPILCMERTYGACDIRDDEAKRLNCGTVLQIGHANYGVKSSVPVVYWDYLLEANPIPTLEKEFSKLENFKNIGLITSVNFAHTILIVKDFLESRGKKVFLAKTEKYEGQILGCRVGAGKIIEKKVDAFLCITAGRFYGLGLLLNTEKPLLNLDLEKMKIHELHEEKNKIRKISEWYKAEFKEARRVGLLITWKRGQIFGDPFFVKTELENKGKEVFLLAFDEVSQDKIEGLKLDFLISFACPRLASDDIERFKVPILNYFQVKD